jgi:type 1 glutamine amidotransferase
MNTSQIFSHSTVTLRSFILRAFVLLSVFVLGHPAFSAESTPIKVLIIDGYSNHDWQRNTPLIRAILDNAGLFQVSVSTAPPTPDAPGWDTWRPKFADYDVVIQTCNDLPGGSNPKTPGPQWPAEVQKAFEEYVAGGGGLFAYHGGNNAFVNWPAYNDMIGIGWRAADFGKAISLDEKGNLQVHEPGDGEKTGHGARVNTVIHRRGEHPIHHGFPEKWMAAELEIYFYARGPAKNMEVISYGLDQKTQKFWPTEWTVQYGKGRVYSSTCGHFWKDQIDPPNLSDVAFQTILPRALQWLAKRDVTYPVPANFPGPEQPSLRVLLSIPPAADGETKTPAAK